MKMSELNSSVVVMIDKNNLVRIDWSEIEKEVEKYLNGEKDTHNMWCFVLWNVKHNHARNLND
jgi:hypothetical protein